MNIKSSNSDYFLSENRWALKLFASKSPVYVLMFTVPMMILMSYIYLQGQMSTSSVAIALVLGAFYWSFVEYLIHRFYFHWNPRIKFIRRLVDSFHIYHHQNPEDMEVINSGPLTAFVGLFFHYGIWLSLTGGNIYFSAAVVLGLLITYSYYEWVHYSVHHKHYKKGLMKFLQEFHLTHHQYPKKNYGQISPIWDFLFQTSMKNVSVSDSELMQSFIKELRDK